MHATHAGRNERLEIYLTQGESVHPLNGAILGKYAFAGIQPTDAEVTIDVQLSYDINGVVQVQALQRDTCKVLAMTVEPVPDDLSWLGRPPAAATVEVPGERIRVYLLIDSSASMTGAPLVQAKAAAHEFLARCDFAHMEVGLIGFASEVALLCEATDNPRRLEAAIQRLEAEGTTNLSDALALASAELGEPDRKRFVVILTDGFPDAAGSAIEQAERVRSQDIEIVAIGTGEADLNYLRRISSSEEGSIFAPQGELVQTFGHIARVIAAGGRALRGL